MAILSGLVLGLLTIVLLMAFFWPFRLDAITKELADESDSKVTAGSFHATYFPHPGCILDQVIFQHNPGSGAPPLITIKQLTIRGTIAGIFANHVKLVVVEGMHILIPPLGSEHFKTPPRSSVVIDDLVADGTILEVASRQGHPASPVGVSWIHHQRCGKRRSGRVQGYTFKSGTAGRNHYNGQVWSVERRQRRPD